MKTLKHDEIALLAAKQLGKWCVYVSCSYINGIHWVARGPKQIPEVVEATKPPHPKLSDSSPSEAFFVCDNEAHARVVVDDLIGDEDRSQFTTAYIISPAGILMGKKS